MHSRNCGSKHDRLLGGSLFRGEVTITTWIITQYLHPKKFSDVRQQISVILRQIGQKYQINFVQF